TETIRNRIKRLYPNLPAINLFPNAYTQLDNQLFYRLPFTKQAGIHYLICLSRYYPHKNIEVLVDVARLICEKNLPYRILITIEAEQHRKAARLLENIKNEDLGDILINIGTVPPTSIASLHKQVDALILPTLLESFSATYVDAMHFGLPVFTSSRDFSREICDECAYYFDPLSADDILRVVENGFENHALMMEKTTQGQLRSLKMPDWRSVTQDGIDAIRSVCDIVSVNTNSRVS
ncbi:glycosyltransferase, partial [Nostoc sp. CHAB 5834]|nr:glycosyltransferase [Nostoc sp. CHAB 5834]